MCAARQLFLDLRNPKVPSLPLKSRDVSNVSRTLLLSFAIAPVEATRYIGWHPQDWQVDWKECMLGWSRV